MTGNTLFTKDKGPRNCMVPAQVEMTLKLARGIRDGKISIDDLEDSPKCPTDLSNDIIIEKLPEALTTAIIDRVRRQELYRYEAECSVETPKSQQLKQSPLAKAMTKELKALGVPYEVEFILGDCQKFECHIYVVNPDYQEQTPSVI